MANPCPKLSTRRAARLLSVHADSDVVLQRTRYNGCDGLLLAGNGLTSSMQGVEEKMMNKHTSVCCNGMALRSHGVLLQIGTRRGWVLMDSGTQ
jgi:hypothetical protein